MPKTRQTQEERVVAAHEEARGQKKAKLVSVAEEIQR